MLANVKSKKFAVVDLEATSAGADARIIQVGIVIIEAGKISRTYATDVNPHEELSQHIKNLTGISDAQLAAAPEFSQVAREIYQLLEDAVFVAHNVKFDANLLAEALFFEGFELRTPRVDTVELAQVLFPTLERYNLPYLAEVLGLDLSEAHTAIADAQATAQLFLRLADKAASLPKLTLAKMLTLADQLLYETGQFLQEIYQVKPEKPLTGWQQVLDLVLRPVRIYAEPYQLSAHFEHNLALLGLEERPQQAEFADLVAQHLADDQVNFIQAQSGIGKTYGYLLPLLARVQNRRIIIATPTKILQDQIMEAEGRRISEVFHLNFHNLKGFSNYIKLDKFWESLERQDANRLINRCKLQILVWLTETETGDLDEIKQQQGAPAYFDELRHDGQLSRSSLFHAVDFWQRSYQKAQVSQVILTNQAYLLTRIADDRTFLDGAVLVIDEAQKLLLQLENFSRQREKIADLLEAVQRLHQESSDLLQRRLLERLSFHLATLAEKARAKTLTEEQIQLIRQDLAEVGEVHLPRLAAVFAPQYDEFWLTTEQTGTKQIRWLNAGSLDFLNFSRLLPESVKVLCVSATLDISPRVSLAQLLGFDEEQVSYDSLPQLPQTGQTIWLPTDLPAISAMSEEAYAQFLTGQIRRLAELNQPMLVLFNANQILTWVSEGLTQAGLAHLAQHIHGTASSIRRRFERGESRILLGSAAFWEGVDFASQPRMLLVLTRLPFENPQDKFVQKINHRLKEEGRQPFRDYQLPLAILKIKQAIGRTRRNQTQKSAVVILDNRILTKPYAKQIQRTLKKNSRLAAADSAAVLEAIPAFLEE